MVGIIVSGEAIMKGVGAINGVYEVGEIGARRLKYGPGGRGTEALVGMRDVGENGARGLIEGQYGG